MEKSPIRRPDRGEAVWRELFMQFLLPGKVPRLRFASLGTTILYHGSSVPSY